MATQIHPVAPDTTGPVHQPEELLLRPVILAGGDSDLHARDQGAARSLLALP